MSERKGIDGREVPGAELMPTTNGTHGKRKKKRGRRGRRGAIEQAVHNGDTEVNGHSDGGVNDDEDTAEDEKPGGVDLLTSETAKLTLNGVEHASEAPSSPSAPLSAPAEAATTAYTAPANGETSTSSDQEHGWQDSAASKSNYLRTATDWTTDPSASDSIVGDIYLRTTPDGTQTPDLHATTKHQNVANWFYAQSTQPYRNLTPHLRQRAIHHLTMQRYPELTAPKEAGDDHKKLHQQQQQDEEDWPRTLRLLIWRAVIRANFFWANPHTNRATGKPKPIVRPAGVFENHFEAFVECAAERLDRIRRDIPDAEYVAGVEAEVRAFLKKVEGMEGEGLPHLAFLLLFEEEQRKGALSVGDMQERIRRAFGVGFNGEGEEGVVFMKGGGVAVKKEGSVSTVVTADTIWREAMKAQL